ncbi:MAG: iron ABC transporter permease [Deltaproteobacteria bacterium]|nr:iron ABC transporter permease [Deltaproteobacteria bacterium]
MIVIGAFVFMLAGAVLSLATGAASAFDPQIFWMLRLPRTLCGLAVGGGLAVAGTLVQASLGNPLADPYSLGIAAAAALGSVLGSFLHTGSMAASGTYAFAFSVVALLALMRWLRKSFRSSTEVLLVGVVSGLFFTSMATFLLAVSDPAAWTSNLGWLLGSIATPTLNESLGVLTLMLAALVAAFSHWKVLDLLSADELTAESAGVDVARFRKRFFFLVAAITAVSVSIAGIIGFLGFLVPHALRALGVRTHRGLVPAAFFAGAGILLFSDVIARLAARPSELPAGVVMALIGAPAFLALIRNRKAFP